MIAEKIIKDICTLFGSDHNQVKIAITQCRAKGVLQIMEVRQLENQHIPISKMLRNILNIESNDGLDTILAYNQITYTDLMCVITIIAQDVFIKQTNQSI